MQWITCKARAQGHLHMAVPGRVLLFMCILLSCLCIQIYFASLESGDIVCEASDALGACKLLHNNSLSFATSVVRACCCRQRLHQLKWILTSGRELSRYRVEPQTTNGGPKLVFAIHLLLRLRGIELRLDALRARPAWGTRV